MKNKSTSINTTDMDIRFASVFILILLGVSLTQCKKNGRIVKETISENTGLQKLAYNNPGLIVDLDAGFKSIPLPMDFDGDSDCDLLVSESGAYVEAGIFYFQLSQVGDRIHVLTPDRVGEKLLIYKDVPENVFWDDNEIILPEKGYDILHFYKNTQWKMIDFDGDGVLDLVCSAYGSREPRLRGAGYKERQKAFLKSPKHSQLVFFKNTGNNNKPVYQDPVEILMENGKSMAKGRVVKPMFADYDQDGDLDFIAIGEPENAEKYHVDWKKNFLLYFENKGTKTNYKFSDAQVLMYNGVPVRFDSRSSINATSFDWNKDGYPDIIAGEESGRVSFLKNTGKQKPAG